MKNQEKESVEEEEEKLKLIICNGKAKKEDINVLINKFEKKKKKRKKGRKKLWHKINRKIMKNKHGVRHSKQARVGKK